MEKHFFIYKSVIYNPNNCDLSSIPMMVRRRFSALTKAAFSTLIPCFENDNINLLIASKYGEFDTMEKLIEQIEDSNEVSPTLFSNSVHNCIAGNFSLIKKITKSYNAVSVGDRTISNAIVQTICAKSPTLFCYADTVGETVAFSCLIGNDYRENSLKCELINKHNDVKEQEYNRFISFLNGMTDNFDGEYYTIRRVYD